MTTLTQPQIDRVNALYKDPETGKGILHGWKMIGVGRQFLAAPAGSDSFAVISALAHKLLEQEQKSEPVYVDLKGRNNGNCPCGFTVAAHWKYCPFCATAITFDPPVVEPEWEVVGLHEEDVWAHLNQDRIVLFWDRHALAWTSFKQDPLPKSMWDAVKAFDDSGAGTFLLVTRKQQQSKEQA